jgi:hypothetical protein
MLRDHAGIGVDRAAQFDDDRMVHALRPCTVAANEQRTAVPQAESRRSRSESIEGLPDGFEEIADLKVIRWTPSRRVINLGCAGTFAAKVARVSERNGQTLSCVSRPRSFDHHMYS